MKESSSLQRETNLEIKEGYLRNPHFEIPNNITDSGKESSMDATSIRQAVGSQIDFYTVSTPLQWGNYLNRVLASLTVRGPERMYSLL